jgi:hypothetical protein
MMLMAGHGHIADVMELWTREVKHHPNIILAQPTQPLREGWLVDEVIRTMSEHPDCLAATAVLGIPSVDSRYYPQDALIAPNGCYNYHAIRHQGINNPCADGSLYGITSKVLWDIVAQHTETPTLEGLPVWLIEHNPQTYLDIDYSHQLPPEVDMLKAMMERVHYMRYPLHLPKEITIVGSNASIRTVKAGAEIDKRPVIRVNWVTIDPEYTGTRCDYHLTKYPHTLLDDEHAPYPAPTLIAGRSIAYEHTPEAWPIFRHAVTPQAEALTLAALSEANGEIYPHDTFISTGLYAIIYALICGAEHIYLAGYGGDKTGYHARHDYKVDVRNNLQDKWAQDMWLAREDKVLEMLQRYGRITMLDKPAPAPVITAGTCATGAPDNTSTGSTASCTTEALPITADTTPDGSATSVGTSPTEDPNPYNLTAQQILQRTSSDTPNQILQRTSSDTPNQI